MVVFTPNDPSETFLQQLDEAIDWSFPNQFEGLEDKVASYIEKRGRERGEIKLHDPIEMYFVPEEVCNRYRKHLLQSPMHANLSDIFSVID